MDTKLLARVGAIAFVAVAITMTAIELRGDKTPPAPAPAPAASTPQVDPLRAALIRCQAIGQAGAGDAECLRTWAESRRRFLAAGRPQESLAETAATVSASAQAPLADAIAPPSQPAPGTDR